MFYLTKTVDGVLNYYTHFCGLTEHKSRAAIYTKEHLKSIMEDRIEKVKVK